MKIYADLNDRECLGIRPLEMFLNGFSVATIDGCLLMKLAGKRGIICEYLWSEIVAVKTLWPKLGDYLIMLRYLKLQFIQITRFPLT